MSSILQILPHPKFEIIWTSGSKVIAKKLTFSQQKVIFLSITFEPVVQLISNFGYGKICRIDDMFAKAVFKNQVARLEDKWPGWERNSCTSELKFAKMLNKNVTVCHAVVEAKVTGVSLSTGPFVFQPSHLIFKNCFSKHVINLADFAIPKF